MVYDGRARVEGEGGGWPFSWATVGGTYEACGSTPSASAIEGSECGAVVSESSLFFHRMGSSGVGGPGATAEAL